jgi:ankyrin repeat protein
LLFLVIGICSDMLSSFSSFGKGIGKILLGSAKTPIESLKDAIISENEEEAIMLFTTDGGSRINKDQYIDPSTLVDVSSKLKLSLLQLAAKHGLYNLVLHFMSKGGNPNYLTESGQSCVHLACSGDDFVSGRLEMLELFFQWKGIEIDGTRETVTLNQVDNEGETALHVAAKNGLVDVCKKLIERGIIVSVVNKTQLNCCEVSDRCGFKELSKMLELALLFQPSDAAMDDFVDTHRFANENQSSVLCLDCNSLTPSLGMKRFIQESIDSLCSQTQVFNNVLLSPGRAEALLNNYGWNVEQIMEILRSDNSSAAYAAAKIEASPTAVPFHISNLDELRSLDSSAGSQTCSICGESMLSPLDPDFLSLHAQDVDSVVNAGKGQRAVYCSSGHVFCLSCWSTHLRTQIKENGGFALQCPGYKCGEILSPQWAPVLLSPELVERWELQRVRHVVDCCPSLKWCPCNACSLVIQTPASARAVGSNNSKLNEHIVFIIEISRVLMCSRCRDAEVDYVWQRSQLLHELRRRRTLSMLVRGVESIQD